MGVSAELETLPWVPSWVPPILTCLPACLPAIHPSSHPPIHQITHLPTLNISTYLPIIPICIPAFCFPSCLLYLPVMYPSIHPCICLCKYLSAHPCVTHLYLSSIDIYHLIPMSAMPATSPCSPQPFHLRPG